jgi:hypothetical protein
MRKIFFCILALKANFKYKFLWFHKKFNCNFAYYFFDYTY